MLLYALIYAEQWDEASVLIEELREITGENQLKLSGEVLGMVD